MNWSIRKRLVALSTLGLTLLLAVGAAGWWNLRRASHTARTMEQSVQAARDHLEMDRMNAAIRADVLALLGAHGAPERDVAGAALAEHVARLERSAERSSHRVFD